MVPPSAAHPGRARPGGALRFLEGGARGYGYRPIIAGGYGGASMAQKLGRKFTNTAVIVIGLVMGLYLLLKAF